MQIIKLGHLLLPKRKREVHLLSRSSFGLGEFSFDVPVELLLAGDISEVLGIVETLEADVLGGVQL
jgi:hypothetical protein